MNAQDLKNSILQLAVQGKLVEQRAEEGTARELLEQIKLEKDQLIKDKKIKKSKPLPEITEEEIPYEIPESWEWVRLGNIIILQSGQDLQPAFYNSEEKGIPYLTGASNIEDGNIIINRWTESPKAIANQGDLLLTCKGTVGKTTILNLSEVHIARQIMGIRTLGASILYIKLFVESQITYLKSKAKSMIPGIERNNVLNLCIPVPPLEEQHRIVAKIEEILPYIDQYDKAYTKLETFNKKFPEDMKKSILQMAMRGKLVEQRPEEGTADELYERIIVEKAQLVKEGKIKKDKRTIDRIVKEEDIPFEIPENWKWVYLGTILNKLTDGTHRTPKYVMAGVKFVSVKDMSSGNLCLDNTKFITQEEHEELYARCNPERGDILLSKVGTTGVPAIVDTDEIFSLFVSVALLKLNSKCIYNKYLYYVIYSPLVQKQASANTRGVGNKNWVLDAIADTVVPLPPLEEQKRIVAKIEEFLPYCDQLIK